MSIPINQVIVFTTVARTGSFIEAAIQLHLSQPALSVAMKNLSKLSAESCWRAQHAQSP